MPNRSNYCLLGVPDHQGVQNVGGRIGAARGPAAFRAQWKRLNGRYSVHSQVMDLGNIEPTTTEIRQTFERVAETLADVHSHVNRVSVMVGGGHDHGYSHLLGIKRGFLRRPEFKSAPFRLGCINLDAHLDVRKIGPGQPILSGSPFFLALEEKVIDPQHFIEFGIQSHSNGRELWSYVEEKNVRVIEWSELRRGKAVEVFARSLDLLAHTCDAIAISLDLDCIAQAYAPGVSAPQAEGFTPMEMIEMLEICGKNRKVASLGIFELNPEHDVDDRTAKLAATGAYHFLEQVMFRK